MNSGLYMGRAGDLLPVLLGVAGGGDAYDQLSAYRYQLQHPGAVVLDYPGKLVLSLHNVRDIDRLLVVEDGSGAAGGKVLRNTVTGDIQCFVHGNGIFAKQYSTALAR